MAGVVQNVQALASSLAALPPEFVRPEHERPRATTFLGASPLQIPVVDMSLPDAGCRMVEAATEWGIFQAVNHGVPADAVVELQRVGQEFFALPQEEKQRYAMDPASGKTEGYGSTVQRSPGDKKMWSDFLFHNVSPPAAVNHGFWPDKPRGYRQANEAYCGHMRRLTREVLERLSAGWAWRRVPWRRRSAAARTAWCSCRRSTSTRRARSRSSRSASRRTPTCARSRSSLPTACRASRCPRTASGATSSTCQEPSSSTSATRSRFLVTGGTGRCCTGRR
ncbi:hypothetical protein VPH35_080123 [Triticum aestivum]